MKKSTIDFIIKMFHNELDGEYYDDFLDQEELDDYSKDLIAAAEDFIAHEGDWFDNYFLNEKLEKYKVSNER